MKTILYTLTFLFLAVFAQAQKTVTYVSYFPPTGIAHQDVVLRQNNKSFGSADLISGENTKDYSTRQGGLILGAKHKAKIQIDDVLIRTSSEVLPYTILGFDVDNIINIEAKGYLDEVNIGNISDKEENPICNDSTYLCNYVFLSASTLHFPMKVTKFNPSHFIIRSSGRALLSNLKVSSSVNKSYNNFPPLDVPKEPTNILNTETRTMTTSDKMQWRKLRINGSEECIMYLTLNPPSDTSTMLGGECRSPNHGTCAPGNGGCDE